MGYFLIFVWFAKSYTLSVDSQMGYYEMSDTHFFSLPKSQQKISLSAPDTLFLDAAIFQATNEARRKNGLPVFQYDFSLYKAASGHANSMITNKFYNHIDPYSPFRRTVDKRVELYTKRFMRIAENIGQYQTIISDDWFAVHYNSKTEQYEYFDYEDYAVCQPYTYDAYAHYVVSKWMGSTSHRINILNGTYTFIGCAARLSANPYKLRRAPYASLVQNFGGEK